jgi:hypothetical protein
MNLLERCAKVCRKVKERASSAYFDVRFTSGHDINEWRPPSRWRAAVGNVVLDVELFAERMEALSHVLAQRTPGDVNNHVASLEDVGRAVYTTKAVVALLLNRQGDVDVPSRDAIRVAVFNIEPHGGKASSDDEVWDEVIVPSGLADWRFEIRHEPGD